MEHTTEPQVGSAVRFYDEGDGKRYTGTVIGMSSQHVFGHGDVQVALVRWDDEHSDSSVRASELEVIA